MKRLRQIRNNSSGFLREYKYTVWGKSRSTVYMENKRIINIRINFCILTIVNLLLPHHVFLLSTREESILFGNEYAKKTFM